MSKSIVTVIRFGQLGENMVPALDGSVKGAGVQEMDIKIHTMWFFYTPSLYRIKKSQSNLDPN